MYWRKRKKQRRIAQHYGFAHYYEYKRSLKFSIYFTTFDNLLKNGLIHWSEVLPRMNRMLCKAGLPEHCMNQEEWYTKVMKHVDELERHDGIIVQFKNDESASQSIKIDKPTNIIVKHNCV